MAAPTIPAKKIEKAAQQHVSRLTGYLSEQIGHILGGVAGLRDGADPIHDTRVAIRRVRSTLRVFATLLDPDAASVMEEELKWFAGVLGEVRDIQVQQRRLRAALEDVPELLVLGPVGSRIDLDLRSVETSARERVSDAMATPRYLTLVAELQRWRVQPPVRSASSKKLQSIAVRAGAKADRRLAQALQGSDDALLHRARKAAKRARYAAELIQWDAPSKEAKRSVKHFKQIQSVLGDLQDTVVARSVLRQLGTAAGTTPGENGFTFGLLYACEEHLAQQCRRDVATLA